MRSKHLIKQLSIRRVNILAVDPAYRGILICIIVLYNPQSLVCATRSYDWVKANGAVLNLST